MPQNYSGSTSGLTGRPTVTISEPVGTDQRNAVSVQTPLRALANFVQYLMTNAAFLGANVFTATQQISSGALELTQAAAQAILKAGSGKLQVGTKAGNNSDVEWLTNGVVKAALLAAGGFDMKSQRIVNVTDPSAAQDAATKVYVDALQAAAPPAWTTAADPTNWNTFGSVYSPPGGLGVAYLKTYGVSHVHVALKRTTSAYASGDAIVTLPAGQRPRTDVPLRVSLIDGSSGARTFADGLINEVGAVRVYAAVNSGTWVVLQAAYPAA
jgi:hypothetical protein